MDVRHGQLRNSADRHQKGDEGWRDRQDPATPTAVCGSERYISGTSDGHCPYMKGHFLDHRLHKARSQVRVAKHHGQSIMSMLWIHRRWSG